MDLSIKKKLINKKNRFRSWERCIIGSKEIVKNALHYYDSKLKVYDFRNIKHIGCSSFYGTKIEKGIFGLSTETIGPFAFSNCFKLGPEIYFPPGIKEIGKNSFKNCFSVKQIYIPSTIEYIGKAAFMNCKNLETVVIDKNFGEFHTGEKAFFGVPANIYFNGNNVDSDEETVSI